MKWVKLGSGLLYIAFIFSCYKAKINTPENSNVPERKRKVEIIDREALSILDSLTVVEIIAQGFNWTEGPLYNDDGRYFIFSDIPENKIYKWKKGESVNTFLSPSGYTGIIKREKTPGSNGLLLHPDGHLVLMQQGDRRVAKMTASLNDPKPEFVTLVDSYKGKRLNSPNDGVYHPNGDLYFTDPPYGLDKGINDPSKELDFSGVYRLKPSGELDLLTKELRFPNGITLSPDGKFLYVANSDEENMIWMQYELDDKGWIKNKREFYQAHAYEGKHVGAPDGMKMNKDGYLFATGPEGLWLFNPGGKVIARIYTGALTSNCALSSDQKSLYMTCDNYIMLLKLK